MMKRFGYILLAFFFYCQMVSGQTHKSFFLDITSADQSQVFDNILEILSESDYFIQSVDKDAGMIQCKIVVKDKRWLSSKKGDVLEYNLLLRTKEDKVRIHLQANVLEKRFTNEGYYNDDLGITNDQKYYDAFLIFLKEHLNKKGSIE